MKTVETKIYSFDELSEKAKRNATGSYEYEDFWYSERKNSYKKAKEIYSLFAEIDLAGERLYTWIQNNVIPEFTRVKKYSKNNSYFSESRKIFKDEKARFSKIIQDVDFCITGYCDDYSFFDPLQKFYEKPDKQTNSRDFAEIDLDSIFSEISENEYRSFFEYENFSEHCEANEIYFLENGKIYNN